VGPQSGICCNATILASRILSWSRGKKKKLHIPKCDDDDLERVWDGGFGRVMSGN
jgi:hypothetical protein